LRGCLVQPGRAVAEEIGRGAGSQARVDTEQARAASSNRRARLANPWTAAWLAGSSRASSRHAAVQPRAAVSSGGADAVQRLTDSGRLARSAGADLRATSGSRVASASVGSTGAARIRRAGVRAAAAHLAGVA